MTSFEVLFMRYLLSSSPSSARLSGHHKNQTVHNLIIPSVLSSQKQHISLVVIQSSIEATNCTQRPAITSNSNTISNKNNNRK